MDLSDKVKFGLDKDGDGDLQYQHQHQTQDRRGPYPAPSMSPPPSGISADWQRGLIPATTTVTSTPWEHHQASTSENLGFPLNDDGTATSADNNGLIVKPVPGNWNHPPPDHHMSKSVGGVFPQPCIGILSSGLSQFPADSAFIERAARFSYFGNGNFTSMLAPFGSLNPYHNSPALIAGQHPPPPQRNESSNMERDGGSKDLTASGQGGSNVGSPVNSEKDTSAGDNRGDVEVSDSGREDICSKGTATRKRKWNSKKEMEIDKSNEEHQNKEEENKSNLGNNNKSYGKQAKEVPDPPKEDYIHVRARRGQATNSHSLAERVRREKISERMKFLQDLVPGCTKVTGKAVMLDEIINYVQSLQRQVEFLSMKLSAVDPQLDFNLGLLSKDMVQSRASSSSVIGFQPDLVNPFQHPNTQGLMQLGNSGYGGPPSDGFHANIPLENRPKLPSVLPFWKFPQSMAEHTPSTCSDTLEVIHRLQTVGSSLDLPSSVQLTCDEVSPLFDRLLSLFFAQILRSRYPRPPLPHAPDDGRLISLLRLFASVRGRGGYDIVTSSKSWGFVAEDIGLGIHAGSVTKLLFKKHLFALEIWFRMILNPKEAGEKSEGVAVNGRLWTPSKPKRETMLLESCDGHDGNATALDLVGMVDWIKSVAIRPWDTSTSSTSTSKVRTGWTDGK